MCFSASVVSEESEGEVMRANRMLRAISAWGAAMAVVGVLTAVSAQHELQEQSAEVKKLLAERACAGCNLPGAALSAAKLAGVNLTGANLFEAVLYFTDLTGANLAGANLTKANLGKAQLKDADLRGADLTGADLRYATDVNFDGAITTATTTCPDGSAGPCR